MSATDIRKTLKLMESIANEAYDDSNPYPYGGGPRPPSLEQAFQDGYERGATWPVEWDHVPGGPWATTRGHHLTPNPQWDEYADHTQAVRQEYLRGWWTGLFAKNDQHPVAIRYADKRSEYMEEDYISDDDLAAASDTHDSLAKGWDAHVKANDAAARSLGGPDARAFTRSLIDNPTAPTRWERKDETGHELDEAKPLPRFIPQGSEEVKDPESSAVVYKYVKDGKPVAIGYAGNGGKSKWHYRFKDDAACQKYIDQFFASVRSSEQYRKDNDRRKIQGKPRGVEVGEIFYTSWGYSMTIVDFYEVINLVGNSSAIVRKLAQQEADGKQSDGWTGHAVPVKGEYAGPEVKVSRIVNGSCKIEGHHAWKWDGKPKYWNRLD